MSTVHQKLNVDSMLFRKHMFLLPSSFFFGKTTPAASIKSFFKSPVNGHFLSEKDLYYKKSAVGVDNDVFFVYKKANQAPSFVLKQYNKYNEKSLERILKISMLENGICKPAVLDYDLKKKYILFRYVNGRHINVEKDDLAAVAKLMGSIHKAEWEIENMPAFNIFDSIEYYLPLCKTITSYDWIKSLYGKLKYVRKSYQQLPKGFIHGDISDTNILICDNQFYTLDFDQAKIAPYLYDLARSLIFFAFNKRGEFEHERAKRMVDTYRQELSLKNNAEEITIQLLHLALIEMLLCTFYYVEIAKEVSPNILTGSRENQHYMFTIKKLRNLSTFYEKINHPL